MPEAYIVYRYFFEGTGLTAEWRRICHSLTGSEKEIALEIIESNDFKDFYNKTNNQRILELLKHYTIKREDVDKVKDRDINYEKTKNYFNRLIKEDQFKDLTYDYEAEVARKIHVAKI